MKYTGWTKEQEQLLEIISNKLTAAEFHETVSIEKMSKLQKMPENVVKELIMVKNTLKKDRARHSG